MKFEGINKSESITPPAWERNYEMLMGIIREIDLTKIKKGSSVAKSIDLLVDNGKVFYKEDYLSDVEAGFELEEPVYEGISISFGNGYHDRDVSVYCFYAEEVANSEGKIFNEYIEKFKQIQNFEKRQIGSDKQIILLDNLENQRKAIHDRASKNITRSMLKDSGVIIDEASARRLFEILFHIWETQKEDELFYIGNDYNFLGNPEVVREISSEVKNRTGVDVDFSSVVFGFHENNPTFQGNFKLKGENVKTVRSEIEDIINKIITKYKK